MGWLRSGLRSDQLSFDEPASCSAHSPCRFAHMIQRRFASVIVGVQGRDRPTSDCLLSPSSKRTRATMPQSSLCPSCGTEVLGPTRYLAALCARCIDRLVDKEGRKATLRQADPPPGVPWGTGIVIEVEGRSLPADTPLFAGSLECRAREVRFIGLLVQPISA